MCLLIWGIGTRWSRNACFFYRWNDVHYVSLLLPATLSFAPSVCEPSAYKWCSEGGGCRLRHVPISIWSSCTIKVSTNTREASHTGFECHWYGKFSFCFALPTSAHVSKFGKCETPNEAFWNAKCTSTIYVVNTGGNTELRKRRILKQTDNDEERDLFKGSLQWLKSNLASIKGQKWRRFQWEYVCERQLGK